MEMKLKENNDEVLAISSLFKKWQETMSGPTLQMDAKMFQISSQLNISETERETEFGLMKEVMKKLVYALEDKASQDMILSNKHTSLNTPAKGSLTSRKASLPADLTLNRNLKLDMSS